MIKVFSEIGKLKTVLVHRPGDEVENLTPDLMERLLFDDIPYLKVAQEEHDAFADAMRKEGIEVLYIEKMVAEALEANPKEKENFVKQFMEEADVKTPESWKAVHDYLLGMDNITMIRKMIAGIRKDEVPIKKFKRISDFKETEYPFYADPLPNILFQRDPFASMGNGVTIHRMKTVTRRRETLFSRFMFDFHPRFKDKKIPRYYSRNDQFSIEGGDVLIINKETVAVGLSERTQGRAAEELAHNLFFENDTTFKKVIGFELPKKRAFMHLDTVFTQIDHNKFTYHPDILSTITVYEITKGKDKELVIKPHKGSLKEILERVTGIKNIELIPCGGPNDTIASGREQWNDGANTLCIEPGTVVVYERNWVTNGLLEKAGIRVIKVPSAELSRGRGGPRCMSMPLEREEIK